MREINRISNSEMELLEIIWDNGGAAYFADIIKMLPEETKINTVLTLLSRLAKKEILEIKKRKRLNEYVAKISREEYRDIKTKKLLSKYYKGSVKNLVATLMEQNYISDEDKEELIRFWKEGKK